MGIQKKISFLYLSGATAFEIHERKLKQEWWLYTNTNFREVAKQNRADPDYDAPCGAIWYVATLFWICNFSLLDSKRNAYFQYPFNTIIPYQILPKWYEHVWMDSCVRSRPLYSS